MLNWTQLPSLITCSHEKDPFSVARLSKLTAEYLIVECRCDGLYSCAPLSPNHIKDLSPFSVWWNVECWSIEAVKNYCQFTTWNIDERRGEIRKNTSRPKLNGKFNLFWRRIERVFPDQRYLGQTTVSEEISETFFFGPGRKSTESSFGSRLTFVFFCHISADWSTALSDICHQSLCKSSPVWRIALVPVCPRRCVVFSENRRLITFAA